MQLINDLLKRIPILRTIYSAIGQMTESFVVNNKKGKKSVVLVQYPRKGMGSWFCYQGYKGEINSKNKRTTCQCICSPITPNPTSGFLLTFPKKVIYLDMTFEEASKFIVFISTSSSKS